MLGIDLAEAVWRKSTRSSGDGATSVRDSKHPTGPALIFTSGE